MVNVIHGAAAKATIGWVSGRVVDLDGHALPGATVNWWGWVTSESSGGRNTDPERAVFTAHADSDGRFRLGIPAGAANVLWLEAPGYGRLRVGDDQIPDIAVFPDATNDLGDIALATENAIAGRVIDGGGLPIGGARIEVRPYTHQLAHTITDNGQPVTAVAADDGRFRVGSLPIGDASVHIAVPGHAEQRRHAHFTHRERIVDLGEIRFLDERTEIRGRVVDDEDAPVAGARVHANEDREVFALTDASGVFTLSARTSRVDRATVRKEGFIGYSTRVDDPQNLGFEIQRAFYLEGCVRDAQTDQVLVVEDLSICEVHRREVDGTISYVG